MTSHLPVSLCMIVKNEERFIGTALQSVRAVLGVEDVVVVDTGSSDRTREIALENGANVFDFELVDDFSAARNFSAKMAENDWILSIDADEELTEAGLDELAEFLADKKAVGVISLFDLTNKKHSALARLYNRTSYFYEGRIHEQLRAVDGVAGLLLKDVGISMVHHGYLPEYNKIDAKLERNENLLLAELKNQPENPYLLYQLGKSYFCNDRDLLKACECFEKALNFGADVKFGYTYDLVECYGYALINTGQYEKALSLRDTYSIYYDDRAQFRFLTAHIFQNNGMFAEAVDSYESCLDADAKDKSGITSYLSYYNIGVILECAGMPDDAAAVYKSCGDYPPALARLAELGW